MGNKHLSPGLTKCLGNFKGDQGLILEDEDGIPREVGFAHVPSAISGRGGLAARIESPARQHARCTTSRRKSYTWSEPYRCSQAADSGGRAFRQALDLLTGVTVAVLKITVLDQRAPFHVPRCRHSLYYGLRHLGLFGQRSSSCCAQTLPPAAAAHPALDDRPRDRSGETSGWIWSWTWFSSACLATRHRRVSFRKGGHTSLARAANKNNGKAW